MLSARIKTYPRARAAMAMAMVVSFAGMLAAPGGAEAQKAMKISKKLIDKAKDSMKELEKADKQLRKTMERYNKVLTKEKAKDRKNELKKLSDELKNSRDRANDVRKKVEEMGEEASKFWLEWAKGLGEISDTELRAMGQENLDKTKARYNEIIFAANDAEKDFDQLVTDLENQIQYLGVDVSHDAVAQLDDMSTKTNARANQLSASIDTMIKRTQEYIRSVG